jgi:putative mycofactocin binding protein MftB
MESTTFDVAAPWQLSPDVSIRDEIFGALAYHHITRRLVFLKSRTLVDVVRDLHNHASAQEAIASNVAEAERDNYARALSALVNAEVVCGRQ